MSTRSNSAHPGPRVTELIAPIALVVLILLGIGSYLQHVRARMDARPEKQLELNLAFPDRRPAPGFPARP